MNFFGYVITSKYIRNASIAALLFIAGAIGLPDKFKSLVYYYFQYHWMYFLIFSVIIILFVFFMHELFKRSEQAESQLRISHKQIESQLRIEHELIESQLRTELDQMKNKHHSEVTRLENERDNAISLLSDSEARSKIDVTAGIPNELKLRDDISNYFDSKPHTKEAHLIFIDINNFRKINNDYGHLFGDKVIRYIAQHFHTEMRRSEGVYRYPKDEGKVKFGNVYRKYAGGDEFVFLIGGDQAETLGFVARMHNAFEILEKNSEMKIGKSVVLSFDAIVIPIYKNQKYEEALMVIGQCYQRICHAKDSNLSDAKQRIIWHPDNIETSLSKDPKKKEQYNKIRKLFKVVNIDE